MSHEKVPKTLVSCQMRKALTIGDIPDHNHFSHFSCASELPCCAICYAILFRISVAYLNAICKEQEDYSWSHFSFYPDADIAHPSAEQLLITSGFRIRTRKSNWNSIHLRFPTPELRNWIECDPTCPSGNERIQYGVIASQVRKAQQVQLF